MNSELINQLWMDVVYWCMDDPEWQAADYFEQERIRREKFAQKIAETCIDVVYDVLPKPATLQAVQIELSIIKKFKEEE